MIFHDPYLEVTGLEQDLLDDWHAYEEIEHAIDELKNPPKRDSFDQLLATEHDPSQYHQCAIPLLPQYYVE